MYIATLLLEAGVVAAVTAAALALAVRVAGPISTVHQALLVGTVMGALIHVAFELAGANTYYCKAGAACRS
jgi:hypothetical protein